MLKFKTFSVVTDFVTDGEFHTLLYMKIEVKRKHSVLNLILISKMCQDVHIILQNLKHLWYQAFLIRKTNLLQM